MVTNSSNVAAAPSPHRGFGSVREAKFSKKPTEISVCEKAPVTSAQFSPPISLLLLPYYCFFKPLKLEERSSSIKSESFTATLALWLVPLKGKEGAVNTLIL